MVELSWASKLREQLTTNEGDYKQIIENMLAYGEECERQIDKDMANQRLLEEHIALENYNKALIHYNETRAWLKSLGIEVK